MNLVNIAILLKGNPQNVFMKKINLLCKTSPKTGTRINRKDKLQIWGNFILLFGGLPLYLKLILRMGMNVAQKSVLWINYLTIYPTSLLVIDNKRPSGLSEYH